MQSPDKTFRFEFRSIPTKDLADSWIVHLHFPANSGPGDELPIDASDGLGEPIDKGVFEFMGRKCRISSGAGSMLYADFIAGIHEKAVWLHRPGRIAVPGGLTFA